MKKMKLVLFIAGVILLLLAPLYLCLRYETCFKKTVCDTSVSPEGRYTLTLLAIGEPDWPFGSASGRLSLKEGDIQISNADFELKNDGYSISSGCWTVTWQADYVEVILSGEEQFDEQILLYFDGTAQRRTLDNETEPTIAQAEIDALDIQVMEIGRAHV